MGWNVVKKSKKAKLPPMLSKPPKNGKGKMIPCHNDCGRKIYRTETQVKKAEHHFCCRQCSAKFKFRNQMITGSTGPTGIEVTLGEILDEMNLSHEPQKLLCERMHVDEFLPEHNLVIEAQGEFWHKRKGAKKRDKRRQFVLNRSGYKVLAIWEKEFKNKKAVKRKIKNQIAKIKNALF